MVFVNASSPCLHAGRGKVTTPRLYQKIVRAVHTGDWTIAQIKDELAAAGIPVRRTW